jgi:hypothetical protein
MCCYFWSPSTTILPSFFRLTAFRSALIALFVAMQTAAMSLSASGAPNIGLTSCTKKQIDKYQKSKDGKKCSAKADRDLINNSKTIHGIYCSSSGAVSCCAYKDGKVVDGSCETIKEARVPFTPRPSANKGTISGGAERPPGSGQPGAGPQGSILDSNPGFSGSGPRVSPVGSASPSGGAAPAAPLR